MTPQECKRELRRLNPAQLRAVVLALYQHVPELVEALVELERLRVPVPVPGQLELPC